jgi:putative phosphoesterase
VSAERRSGTAEGDAVSQPTRVGLVSDTHGWLDPRVHVALAGELPLDGIVHAGDIGHAGVIDELELLAPPVMAVRGNCDYSSIPGLPEALLARRTVAGKTVLVIHDLKELPPRTADADVIVCGHSHVPSIRWRDGMLVVNPGSATQRRRQASCTVGVLEIKADGGVSARILELDEFGERTR